MLATLNSKQIVDEIVKDTTKDNDPHDALDIAPEIVLASRPDKAAPTLVPDSALRPEPKINLVTEAPAAALSVDTAVRAAAGDIRRKRSSVGRWLRGAFVTLLFAAGSAAATVAWQTHGDTAKAMVAAWMPALVASPSQATPPVTEQPASTEQQATTADQPAEQPATPAQAQDNSNTSAPATASDAPQSLQSMTRDLAAMTQQIEQLKANIAELKASQEQMAREIAKASAPPRPAEARIADPRAKLSALPPRPPAPPVRKPRPVAAAPAYAPTYAPAPIAPPPQAAAVPPPPPPASASQLADDDGPVVRPPMPVH
ncbi:hypothetical protein Q2941_41230 [Bradyrhizobium sp. UFLA05-153]